MSVERLGGVAIGERQEVGGAIARHLPQRVLDREPRAGRLHALGVIGRALPPDHRHIRVIDVKQAVVRPLGTFEERLPFVEPCGHGVCGGGGAIDEHPQVEPLAQPAELRADEHQHEQQRAQETQRLPEPQPPPGKPEDDQQRREQPPFGRGETHHDGPPVSAQFARQAAPSNSANKGHRISCWLLCSTSLARSPEVVSAAAASRKSASRASEK